jgi:hypothetical protein
MPAVMKWLQYRSLTVLCVLALAPSAALADPAIEGINPDQGPIGSFATIHGSDFGDAMGRSHVLMGGRMIPVLAWSPIAISIYVDPLAFDKTPIALDTAYPVQVIKISGAADRKASNTVNFTLTAGAPPPYSTGGSGETDQPIFESFQSSQFCAGDFVIFHGRNFGAAQGHGSITLKVPFRDAEGKLFFQEFAVPVLAWYNTQIHLRLFVPAGAELGTYTVTVRRDDGKTASGSFTVVACT